MSSSGAGLTSHNQSSAVSDEVFEQNLELFIEITRQLGISTCDFQPNAQTALNQKINTLISYLKNIDKLREEAQSQALYGSGGSGGAPTTSSSSSLNVFVPTEVFDYVDDGKNPQLYTRDFLEKTLSRNEEVKGRIETFEKFRTMLLAELSDVFPKEMSQYRVARGEL